MIRSARFSRLASLVLAAPLALALSGCGVIFNGTSTTVPATSTPDGAEVFVDGSPVGVTPTRIKLAHNRSHTVMFRFADGREQQVHVEKELKAGYIVLDVLLAGLVGVVVDAATDGWSGPDVDSVHGSAPRKAPPTEQAAKQETVPVAAR